MTKLIEGIDQQIRQIDKLYRKHPLVRLQRLNSAIDDCRVGMSRLATERARALVELRQSGRSATEIAEDLGITRQQVYRLIREAEGTG